MAGKLNKAHLLHSMTALNFVSAGLDDNVVMQAQETDDDDDDTKQVSDTNPSHVY